jgi:hypothetical protein
MSHRAWIFAALLGGTLACSNGGTGHNGQGFQSTNSSTGPTGGSGSAETASSGGMASAGETSSGETSSSGSAVDTSGSNGGGGSGPGTEEAGVSSLIPDASLPDADSFGPPITLTMNSFSVPPNSEVYKCQQFGNPFGQDVDLVKMVGTMSTGSHHFFLFNMSPSTGRSTTAPLEDCPQAGLEFHPFPYLSQQPNWTVEYPQGMGYPLISANGLMMNAHFLNASAQTVTPQVTITIYPAKPGTVTTHIGTLFLNDSLINVPAGTTQAKPLAVTSSDIPIKDQSYTIFTNWSHMHQYSLDFQASTNGSVFYDEKQWDEPPLTTAATSSLLPLKMAAGSQITWTCMYYNPTSKAMPFGDSAQTDDMCIYLGQYYPAEGTRSTNPNYPDILYDSASGL